MEPECGFLRGLVGTRHSASPVPPKDSFLLGHTHSTAPAASGLGVLTPDTKAPKVAQPSMGSDFLQPLQVLTQLVV